MIKAQEQAAQAIQEPQAQPAGGARIVVVGGGVAGLEVATALGKLKSDCIDTVTLVDSDSAHVWKPMLHTIAAGTRDLAQQQTTYLAQATDAHFAYQPGEMCGLDRSTREVLLAPIQAPDGREIVPSRRLPYDKLVIAVGSGANDFGTPGVTEHCFMIDSRRKADAFNQEIRLRMVQCMTSGEQLQVAIVGAGATGVELAAELVQLAESATAYGALGVAAKFRIVLIEAGPRVLPSFPEEISEATRQRLEALGVSVIVSGRVKSATAQGFELANGELIAASLRVWAAGVKAPEFLTQLGLETTRSNQLLVNDEMQTSDPAIYALGDCASYTLPGQESPLPPTAQVAHQQARYLIETLPHLLERPGAKPVGFAYRDFGALVSLAQYDAYGSLGKFGLFNGGVIRGRLAMLSHIMLYRSHQARLYGFWRGGLLWLIDLMNSRLRPSIRLD
ncbi:MULTISPECIES: NAD(P)/FAD-dependent oxidoreductase [unclassified Comamonas]|uniref:NAD(P)/FAD-dependent oxidoreductase n=1 Tax=unclassified Comamonas TaxID=2638500 RepID=UPI000EAC50B3|nr:FAD-dependent oxidoreductase [Comamonas sp. lk]